MSSNTNLQDHIEQAEIDLDSPLPTVPQDVELLPVNNIDHARKRVPSKQELHDLAKTFGEIPQVPIFTQWETRAQCCNAAVHRTILAGICGNRKDGVFSIALSSFYKDDEDRGDTIIYTGTGGRERWSRTDPPKRLHMGPQTMDQSWDHPSNRALKVSFLTGNPVRVIRSWKCPSPYAPMIGYRYDGLYKVSACWTAKGQNGRTICCCQLDRLPNQPAIPEQPTTLSTTRIRNIESDVQVPLPNPPHQGMVAESTLARYRWDPKRCELVRVLTPGSPQIPGEEECQDA